MFLDAVKELVKTETGEIIVDENLSKTPPVFEKWRNFPFSKISHHGRTCCEIAREWLLAMDFSELGGASPLTGPRWLRQKYNWGPNKWELFWCEAVGRKTLDCGALASITQELFKFRGVKNFPVQLVQKFNASATGQWAAKWQAAETSAHWIEADFIYHEGCAVVTGNANEIKIWDPSAGWWLDSRQISGYGSLAALKLTASGYALPEFFEWENRRIVPNQWLKVSAGNDG